MKYEAPKAIDLNGPEKAGFTENPAGCQSGITPDNQVCAAGGIHTSIQCCNAGSRANPMCLSGSIQQW
jgi:hypothetical protein